MNRHTMPNTPDDLLARCLATIPTTAQRKLAVPRPSPDAGSRKRLAGLAVAAVVPIVTVLAVLPMRYSTKSYRRTESGSPKYVRACNSLLSLENSNGQKTVWSKKYTTVTIMDFDRGIVSFPVTSDTRQPISVNGENRSTWRATLSKPDGRFYSHIDGSFSKRTMSNNAWQKDRGVWDRSLLFATVMSSEFGNRTRSNSMKVEQREDKWQGHPVIRLQITPLLPLEKRQSYLTRYYVDKETRLTLAMVSFTILKDKLGKKTTEILETTFYYNSKPGEEKYFDVDGFRTQKVFR